MPPKLPKVEDDKVSSKRKRDAKWSKDEVIQLIQLRKEFSDYFTSGKIQEEGWRKLVIKSNFDGKRTAAQLREKWCSLRKIYTKERSRRNLSGESEEGSYMEEDIFEMLEEILESDPLVNLSEAPIESIGDKSAASSQADSDEELDVKPDIKPSTSQKYSKKSKVDDGLRATLDRIATAADRMADSFDKWVEKQ